MEILSLGRGVFPKVLGDWGFWIILDFPFMPVVALCHSFIRISDSIRISDFEFRDSPPLLDRPAPSTIIARPS
jgi:hypothetical protein